MATTGARRETSTAGDRRWRSWRWVIAMLLVLATLAGIDAYLTAPRPGARMDPEATGPDGAHALGVPLDKRLGRDGVSRPVSTGQPILELFA